MRFAFPLLVVLELGLRRPDRRSLKVRGTAFRLGRLFPKPSNGPFQEQYSKAERTRLLLEAFSGSRSWILSGSIVAWGVRETTFTHAVLLNVDQRYPVKSIVEQIRSYAVEE